MIKMKLVELFSSLGIDQTPKHYVNRIELYNDKELSSQHIESIWRLSISQYKHRLWML